MPNKIVIVGRSLHRASTVAQHTQKPSSQQ